MELKFWEIVLPIICGAIVAVILYSISKNKKLAILLVMGSVLCSAMILYFLQHKQDRKNIYLDEYVYINYGKLECIDNESIDHPCNIRICESEKSNNEICVFIDELAVDRYNDFLQKHDFFSGWIEGYLVAYAGGDYDTPKEQILQTENRGVWFDKIYVNYLNTKVYEGQVDGKQVLAIIKVLYIGESQILIATLKYENIDYEFFCNSKNKDIVEFRDCFESIEQRMVQVSSD